MHRMNKKILLVIGIIIIIILGVVGIALAHKYSTRHVATNAFSPCNITRRQMAPKGNEFFARILIVDKNFLDRWYSTNIDNSQYVQCIDKVTSGQVLFFPIIFTNFAIDANGNTSVSATESLINPQGKVISTGTFDNIASGMTVQQAHLAVLQHSDKGILGDNFTSAENPQNYPLGMYTIKAVITDTIAGKTITDSVKIEKTN